MRRVWNAVLLMIFMISLSIAGLCGCGEKMDGDAQEQNSKGNAEQQISSDLRVNEIRDLSQASLDADVQTISMDTLPGTLDFLADLKLPRDYEFDGGYLVYTRSDRETETYDVLHDSVVNYRKDEKNRVILAVSELEAPLRDYLIDGEMKTSRIKETELVICQYGDMYLITFRYEGRYYDLETTGLSLEELKTLLCSIIRER